MTPVCPLHIQYGSMTKRMWVDAWVFIVPSSPENTLNTALKQSYQSIRLYWRGSGGLLEKLLIIHKRLICMWLLFIFIAQMFRWSKHGACGVCVYMCDNDYVCVGFLCYPCVPLLTCLILQWMWKRISTKHKDQCFALIKIQARCGLQGTADTT